jgi:hypothetical protein
MVLATSIYVLPTEAGYPPRALLRTAEYESEEDVPDSSVEEGEEIEGALALWSRDLGVWTVGGVPVPEDLGEAITEHAKDLGVEW